MASRFVPRDWTLTKDLRQRDADKAIAQMEDYRSRK